MRRFILGLLCGCVFMCLLGFYIWHQPPLIRMSEWNATYTSSGTSYTDGSVFGTLFPSDVYFIFLLHAPEGDRWFAFRPSHRIVGQPNHPRRTLFGYFTPRNTNVGVLLGDPKHQREWHVDYSNRLPRFSTTDLAVEITDRDSN